jgi:hypothetical protein
MLRFGLFGLMLVGAAVANVRDSLTLAAGDLQPGVHLCPAGRAGALPSR